MYYDDAIVSGILHACDAIDIKIDSHFYEPMKFDYNVPSNRYFIKGLCNQGRSSYVPSIYKMTFKHKITDDIIVNISQIYDKEQVNLVHAWSIRFESAKNLEGTLEIIRMFAKVDDGYDKIVVKNFNKKFSKVIKHIKEKSAKNSVYIQIIIDLI